MESKAGSKMHDLECKSNGFVCLFSTDLPSKRVMCFLSSVFKIIWGLPSRGAHIFQIIDPLIPKDMFRLVCLVKLVFFAREGVAF